MDETVVTDETVVHVTCETVVMDKTVTVVTFETVVMDNTVVTCETIMGIQVRIINYYSYDIRDMDNHRILVPSYG